MEQYLANVLLNAQSFSSSLVQHFLKNTLFGRFGGLLSCSRTFELKGPSDWQLVGAFSPQLLINRAFYHIKNSRLLGHPWISYRPEPQTKQLVASFGENDSKLQLSEAEDAFTVNTCPQPAVLFFCSDLTPNKAKPIGVLTLCLRDTHVPGV